MLWSVPLSPWVSQVLGSLLAGLLLAGAPGALIVLPRLAAIEKGDESQSIRISNLESGRTTPISAEATARLNQHDRELAELRIMVRDLTVRIDSLLAREKRREDSLHGVQPGSRAKGG